MSTYPQFVFQRPEVSSLKRKTAIRAIAVVIAVVLALSLLMLPITAFAA